MTAKTTKKAIWTLGLFAAAAHGATLATGAQSSDVAKNISSPSIRQTSSAVVNRDEQYTIDALDIRLDTAANILCMDISGTSDGPLASPDKPIKMSLSFCTRPDQQERSDTDNPVVWAQRLDIVGNPRANSVRFRMNASIGFEHSFHSAEKAVLLTHPVSDSVSSDSTIKIRTMHFSSKSTPVTITHVNRKPLQNAKRLLSRFGPQLAEGFIVDSFAQKAVRRVTTSEGAIVVVPVREPTPGLKLNALKP